ncbi:MAG: PilZ domain-containing protein, partial [Proteobacteria bacterium]|nr:PilZ domain-containing protein [Pseudomonadota bacterium]
MEMRICPECNKVFYFLADKKSYSCSHCGFILLKQKREYKRIEKTAGCVFSYHGVKYKGIIKDYSFGGACVEYAGEFISEDILLDFESSMLGFHVPAKAVWSLSRPSKG